MKNVLCLTDSLGDISHFVKNANMLFFQIEQLEPEEHLFSFFQEIYQKLKESTDLSLIDLIIAEYVESLPLVYFMRRDGYFCPAIFIPHTNPYPLNILFYFLLVSEFSHPEDAVICGSMQAANGYMQFANIKAFPTCTFGIKSSYQKGNKGLARKSLGIPLHKKILLYTGRFMNDKGLVQILDAYEEIKKRILSTTLVLSVNHIDPAYFNMLASRMQDVILFYRLEQTQMIELYQSADLFISTATSIFETYGKSPLEAISCGVPVVLPRWDGFPYFITNENGSLANVIYSDYVEDAPYSFAYVEIKDFVDKCCSWLSREDKIFNSSLPEWAYYENNMVKLSEMIINLLKTSKKFYRSIDSAKKIDFSIYPPIIQEICSYYSLESCEDIEIKAEELGLINRNNPGNLSLLRKLHDELFKTMATTNSTVLDQLNLADELA